MDDPSLIPLFTDNDNHQDAAKELSSMAEDFVSAEVHQVRVSSLHTLKNNGVLTFKKAEAADKNDTPKPLQLKQPGSETQEEKKAHK